MDDKVYALLVAAILILFFWICSYNSHKKSMLQLERDRLDLDTKLDLEFIDILDKMIMDTFNEYKVLNLAYDQTYINTEKEEQILSEVSDLVAARLSTTFKKQLSLYYNPSVIPEVIGKKIYLIVMNYVIENNQTKSN